MSWHLFKSDEHLKHNFSFLFLYFIIFTSFISLRVSHRQTKLHLGLKPRFSHNRDLHQSDRIDWNYWTFNPVHCDFQQEYFRPFRQCYRTNVNNEMSVLLVKSSFSLIATRFHFTYCSSSILCAHTYKWVQEVWIIISMKASLTDAIPCIVGECSLIDCANSIGESSPTTSYISVIKLSDVHTS